MIEENRKLLDSIPTAHGAPDSRTILSDYNQDDGRIGPGFVSSLRLRARLAAVLCFQIA